MQTANLGPFGEVIRASGPVSKANPFRFSAKYQDDETELLCYGYRYCNASAGRWLSRDPAEEEGGSNLYGFVSNDPCNWFDTNGRAPSQSAAPPQPCSATRQTRQVLYFVNFSFVTLRIDWGLRITDSKNLPVPGVLVTEKITLLDRMNVFSWNPGTGSGVTDSAGSVTDYYVVTWRLPCYAKGWIAVKQDVIVLGKMAPFFTFMDSDGNWNGNLRAAFQ